MFWRVSGIGLALFFSHLSGLSFGVGRDAGGWVFNVISVVLAGIVLANEGGGRG